jgi:hypothetical protein
MNSKNVIIPIGVSGKHPRRHPEPEPVKPRYDGDSRNVLAQLKEVVAAEVVNVVGPKHPQLAAAESLLRTVEEDLLRRQLALRRYSDVHEYFNTRNTTTGRMLEMIHGLEQDRACALWKLIGDLRSRLRNTLGAKLN